MLIILLSIALFTCVNISANCQCTTSITTVYGKSQTYCSGDLIFSDNFDSVDSAKWFFENTMGGGGNGEFQWYVSNDPLKCYSSSGVLHLAPTTTASVFNDTFLSTAHVIIPNGQCTWSAGSGCDKQGTVDNIINPIRSTRMDTRNSFAFKYGVLEIRAKMPAGDWLWPALWLMPKKSVYGGWPRSGEIDLSEVRGNLKLMAPWGVNVGVEQTLSTMHFGPSPSVNGFMTANYAKNIVPGLNNDFHLFKLKWTSNQITFYVDNVSYGTVDAGTGFWNRYSKFATSGYSNPWINGTVMAPFDQEFYIIMNLAVGGINFFSDTYVNSGNPKPWLNNSTRTMADFWSKKDWWLPGWNLSSDTAHLQVDYIKVWAL